MTWLERLVIHYEVKHHMDKIIQGIISWITFGPLKGHRTVVLSVLQVLLAGLYTTGHLKLLSPEHYAGISAAISAAIGMAAANHETKPS